MGLVDCPFCIDGRVGDETCDECDGEGVFECVAGRPENLFEGSRAADLFELAQLIFYSRERQWSPVEYGAQPAIFIHAYEIFLRQVHVYFREVQERNRREREVASGRNVSHP